MQAWGAVSAFGYSLQLPVGARVVAARRGVPDKSEEGEEEEDEEDEAAVLWDPALRSPCWLPVGGFERCGSAKVRCSACWWRQWAGASFFVQEFLRSGFEDLSRSRLLETTAQFGDVWTPEVWVPFQ